MKKNLKQLAEKFKPVRIDPSTGEVIEYIPPVFQTQYNRVLFPRTPEVNKGKSLTDPTQGYTTREILEKFANGFPLNVQREGVFNGDVDLPNWNAMDLAEQQAYIKKQKEKVKMFQEAIKRATKEQHAKEYQKQIDELVAGGMDPKVAKDTVTKLYQQIRKGQKADESIS